MQFEVDTIIFLDMGGLHLQGGVVFGGMHVIGGNCHFRIKQRVWGLAVKTDNTSLAKNIRRMRVFKIDREGGGKSQFYDIAATFSFT